MTNPLTPVGSIHVIGKIWQPGIGTCAMLRKLTSYDAGNMQDVSGKLTRDSVEMWASMNMGDFQIVEDFSVVVHNTFKNNVFVSDWSSDSSEAIFNDCLQADYS